MLSGRLGGCAPFLLGALVLNSTADSWGQRRSVAGPALPSAQVFPITFWAMHYWRDSPDYAKVISEEQYRLIKECNFNLVMGGPLELAQRFGLQCMSDAMSGKEFRELWWTPNDPVTQAQRQRIVAAISSVDRSSPALWGYHLCDEPGEVLYRKVKAVMQIMKTVDATHPIFVNVHPGTDVPKYIAEVDPDLCAYDHYPIFEDGAPLDGNIPPGFEHSNFLNDLARNRKACLTAGLKFLPTMLSCGHYVDYEVEGAKYHRSYGHITEARLRWQVYSALAYNAGGIGWFVYFTPGVKEYDEAAIGADWKPTKVYYWLQKLNREAGVIGALLQGLRSVGVYESEPFYCWHGLGKDEFDRFNPNGLITGVEGGLVTVGEFVDKAETTYLLVVNRNVNDEIGIRLRLQRKRVREITLFDRESLKWSKRPVWKRAQEYPHFTIAAGDGLFLRVR